MHKLSNTQFLRPSFGSPPYIISIEEFIEVAEKHEGLFVVEGIEYDSITAGKDNLYFAYCFNYNSGQALAETLFIVDKITQTGSIFTIISQGKEYTVLLKE